MSGQILVERVLHNALANGTAAMLPDILPSAVHLPSPSEKSIHLGRSHPTSNAMVCHGGTRCPQRAGKILAAAPLTCAFGDSFAIIFGEADPPAPKSKELASCLASS